MVELKRVEEMTGSVAYRGNSKKDNLLADPWTQRQFTI